MPEPARWHCDAMLGRLARYLRILGYDTIYVRDVPDDEIVRRLGAEPRTLVTRDRELGGRVSDSVVLQSREIGGQLGELRRARPTLGKVPRFDRCTACNGVLAPAPAGAVGRPPGAGVPRDRSLWACAVCGHLYWEGSHTDRLRRDLAHWLGSPR